MSSIDLALFYPLNSQAVRVARETDDVAVVALGPETKSVFKKEKLETKHASVCALRESECRNTPLLPLPFFTASRIRVRGENFHSQSTEVCLSWSRQNVYLKIQVDFSDGILISDSTVIVTLLKLRSYFL